MHTRSVLFARLRLRFPRGAVTYWAAVAILVALTVVVVSSAFQRARATQAALGAPTAVVVATSDLAPGTPLDGHAAVRKLPARLVSKRALTALPTGRVATAFIADGEPVLASRVSGNAAAGPSGLVPAGHRALTVPVGSVAPPVGVGDHVDVIATPVPSDTSGSAAEVVEHDALVVEHDALVVATGADGVTVAVPADQAPALAAAIARATVTLALTGPPSAAD